MRDLLPLSSVQRFVATLAAIRFRLGTVFAAQFLRTIDIKDLRLASSVFDRLSSSLDTTIGDALSIKLEAVLVGPTIVGLPLIPQVWLF